MKAIQKSGFVMVLLSTFAGALNYLCQMVMGRVLPVDAFGTMNALFSAILILSVPGTALSMQAARKIAENPQEINGHTTLYRLSRLCLIIAILIAAFTFVGQAFIAKLLDAPDFLIILMGIAAATGLFPYLFSGALTGRQCFAAAGLLNCIAPFSKGIGVIIAAVSSQSTFIKQGIILLFITAGNLIAIFVFEILKKGWESSTQLTPQNGDTESAHTGEVILANAAYLLLVNSDVLMVTVFFGSERAGEYSASMLFGKAIYFFTTALTSVLVPGVSRMYSQGKNPRAMLWQVTLLTATVSLIGVSIMLGFAKPLITLLYGQDMLVTLPYLPYACLIAVPASMLNLFLSYRVGIGMLRGLAAEYFICVATAWGGAYLLSGDVQQMLACTAIVWCVFWVYQMIRCFTFLPKLKNAED